METSTGSRAGKAAVFLDRDGVLIEDRNYVHRVEDVKIIPGGPAALKRLTQQGFMLFIVTNQSGIGRGYYTLEDMHRVNAFIEAEYAHAGVRWHRLYFAPEAPDAPSRGRKPSPQFIFDARDEFGVDLARSFMVGDKISDLECGWNAGVERALLVRTGYGSKTEKRYADRMSQAVIVDDLPAAADWIIQRVRSQLGNDPNRGRPGG